MQATLVEVKHPAAAVRNPIAIADPDGRQAVAHGRHRSRQGHHELKAQRRRHPAREEIP
jgi:hypothetical protein